MRSYVNWLLSNAEVVILRVGCYIPLPTLLVSFACTDLKRGIYPLFKQLVKARQNKSKTVSFLNFNGLKFISLHGTEAIVEASGSLSKIEKRVIPSL